MNTFKGTAILVTTPTLERLSHAGALFMTAQACAALDMEVELYFAAQSVALLASEHAQLPAGYGPSAPTLGWYLTQTTEAGVRIMACSQAMAEMGLSDAQLFSAATGRGGVVQFAMRCADPQWRTLVY